MQFQMKAKMSTLLFHSAIMTTLTILFVPLMVPRLTNLKTIIVTTKLATITSIIPALLLMYSNSQSVTMNLTWTNTLLPLKITFMFDVYATLFMPTALFITWAILEFTKWYMNLDPHQDKFSKYLLLFLIAMLLITTSNNLLQLFIGWEGVGIMSFLLIGWWHGRTNAITAALQAIIYNRIGDIGFILSMAWLSMNYNTLEVQQMLSHPYTPTLPLLGLILAAAGKSAQFGLHPWLPAAMEGPTPVSALLHSSTMVVAGVFLLIRVHPLLEKNELTLTTCLCLGAVTTTFAALCAITQNDIKKIIAFSTSSQLGLMMLTIGLNQPELTFQHITTHAFFKALLFLCAGSLIHNLNNEQDIRKMGGMQKTMPITTSCITLGSLALMGTPFLAGFYTKDSIIEAMNTSHLNAWALMTTMMATSLTAAYSMRLIYYTQLITPRHSVWINPNENDQAQTKPILRLALGAISAGLFVSLIFPNKTQIMTMTTTTKLSACLVTLVGLICALDLIHQTTYLNKPQNTQHHTALSLLMFFNNLAHWYMPHAAMTFAKTSTQNDSHWYHLIIPKMLEKMNTFLTNTLTFNKGLTTTHMKMFIVTLMTCLLWLTL
uniref:NADH-ubiquinone oxidoreductase chain 5 n=1 Tax=Gekko gecko TaxID=36310 RepID=Q2VYA6_GEKGE|nr:NADH dehydrogenase subunit 5 [Gekko gecko]AAQ93004.1 NADH dehydrogenase subunit 5 [Gekko gecko]